MKKVISIILALLMISAVFAVPASAVTYPPSSCDCADHISDGPCACCLYCANLDSSRVYSCVVIEEDENGNRIANTTCCVACTGLFPCTCECPCCPLSDKDKEELGNGNTPLIPEEQQEDIIEAFQKILRQISDFFDRLFNAIFEFLRFDEIMGGNAG